VDPDNPKLSEDELDDEALDQVTGGGNTIIIF